MGCARPVGTLQEMGGIAVNAAMGLMLSLGLLLACALALITLFALASPGRTNDGAQAEIPPVGSRNGISAARLPSAYRRWRHARRRVTGRVARARMRIGE